MLFNETYSKYSNNIAVITDREALALTYDEIKNFSDELGVYLQERSLIFSLCENSLYSLLGYCSFISNKSVPLLLDAAIDKNLLLDLIQIYHPNYLWLPEQLQHVCENANIICKKGNYCLAELHLNKISINNDLALLLTTSGSTGSPKLVRLSYKNIKANAESIAQYLAITSSERPVTSLPMHYSFGLSVINSHLISGATLLLTNHSVLEKEFWNFVREQHATSLSGVPYTFEMLHRLRFLRMDLPSLKTMTQAGGKLSSKLIEEYCEQCRKIGKQFIVMYGQTEATARMSYMPFSYSEGKYGSIGVAIQGGQFKLVDENNVEIDEPDKDGELIYFGDNVSLGYAECQADLLKGDENNGVLHTGDIARRDKDGFYYITGRKKRFIKLYGNRINLDAMEQLLKNNMTDGEFVCSGDDDKMVIFTTTQNKSNDIIQFVVDKTGINKQGFLVKEISSIPKNSSGKILYAELNQLL
jgi:acyl-coenzyme A synthetase/AMP-(fatty) acid ligase